VGCGVEREVKRQPRVKPVDTATRKELRDTASREAAVQRAPLVATGCRFLCRACIDFCRVAAADGAPAEGGGWSRGEPAGTRRPAECSRMPHACFWWVDVFICMLLFIRMDCRFEHRLRDSVPEALLQNHGMYPSTGYQEAT